MMPEILASTLTGRPHRSRYRGVVAATMLAVIAVSQRGDARSIGTRWVAAWTAAMQRPFPDAPERFSNETVRLLVRPGLAGQRFRIILSNRFGSIPLRIGAARAGRTGDDPRVTVDADRIVTFDGKSDIAIAPGRSATSDSIDLAVSPSSRIAVSLYFPGNTPVSTTHTLALQTGYVALGNRTLDFPSSPERTISDRPFLATLEVEAGRVRSVYVFGDSGTDGDGSSENTDRRWTDYLAAKYAAGSRGRPVAILNLGIIGNRLLRDSPGYPPFFDGLGDAGVRRFAYDVPPHHRGGCVVVRIGVNDIGLGGLYASEGAPISATALIAGYRALILATHRRGMRIIGTTITPFEGAAPIKDYYSPAKELTRRQVNRWIRAGGAFDGVSDLDLAVRDPAHPTRLLSKYDSGDHLHANDAGYAALAKATDLSGCSATSAR
jgi:lysophospholipase L1-like esterase